MLEELIPIIIEVLVNHKKPAKIDEVVEISGYSNVEVTKGLNLLTELGLVKKSNESKVEITSYSLIKELKAIHLAKAAQLGVDLNAFDDHFKIDKKEKKLALDLATQAEKIKHLDITKRKPLLQKRRYLNSDKTDDVYDNLMLLFEASNMTLYEYIETMAKKDSYLNLLINMHKESEVSLKGYSDNLR